MKKLYSFLFLCFMLLLFTNPVFADFYAYLENPDLYIAVNGQEQIKYIAEFDDVSVEIKPIEGTEYFSVNPSGMVTGTKVGDGKVQVVFSKDGITHTQDATIHIVEALPTKFEMVGPFDYGTFTYINYPSETEKIFSVDVEPEVCKKYIEWKNIQPDGTFRIESISGHPEQIKVIPLKKSTNTEYVYCNLFGQIKAFSFKIVENESRIEINPITEEQILQAYDKYIAPISDPYDKNIIAVDPTGEYNEADKTLTQVGREHTLAMFNFMRVATGVDPVKLNEDYNKIAQKGAEFMASTGKFGHYIADGIDEEASKALRNSNISSGIWTTSDSASRNPFGYYTDTHNIEPNAGHRTALLNPKLKEIGIGYKGRSINRNAFETELVGFYNYDDPETKVVAVPTAGVYPIEFFQESRYIFWTLQLPSKYKPKNSSMNVNFTVTDDLGNTITLHQQENDKDFENFYVWGRSHGSNSTITFRPDKIIDLDKDNLLGRTFTINIEGLRDTENKTDQILHYDTKIISISDHKKLHDPKISSLKIINTDTNKELEETTEMYVGDTLNLKKLVEPSAEADNYTIRYINYTSNNFYFHIDDTNTNVELQPYEPMTINLALDTGFGGYEWYPKKEFTIIVKEKPQIPDQPVNPDNPSNPEQPGESSKTIVYRLYNEGNLEHLYTSDVNEYNSLPTQGWKQEGTGWIAPTSGEAVYRLYCDITRAHLYTKDQNEINTLVATGNWTVDNNNQPLFYSGGSKNIFRLYNEGIMMHLLTTDENEYNILGPQGWNQEGVALKALS